MATTLRCQLSLVNDTALPRDVAQNTWHFQSDSVDPLDDVVLAGAALSTFYQAIEDSFSENCTGDVTMKWYDLTDGEPRTPIQENGFTITPGAGTAFPNEVAICLSFRGNLLSGTEPKRRRGRIYLGPLSVSVSANGNGDSQVASTTMEPIADAAADLRDAGSPSNFQWAVFSPTTAGPPPWSFGDLAVATFPVTVLYVDNAFDTVRSRGIAATARETRD